MKNYKIHLQLHKWLLNYQRLNGRPPTLDEIMNAHDSMAYRSSARHTLRRLEAMGKVRAIKPQGYPRRYEAIWTKPTSAGGSGAP